MSQLNKNDSYWILNVGYLLDTDSGKLEKNCWFDKNSKPNIFCLYFFPGLGIKPKVSCMLDKFSTAEQYPWPPGFTCKGKNVYLIFFSFLYF